MALHTCTQCGKIMSQIQGRRELNGTRYELCSMRCITMFDNLYPRAVPIKAVEDDEKPDRPGADEQRGWKLHRWWNQFYKRKKDVYAQWQVQREFAKIRRKAMKK